MHCGNTCDGVPITPSGHSPTCYSDKIYAICDKFQKNNAAMNPNEGPFKDSCPPGSREPAIGEHEWGDVPYLPSYLDPMYPVQSQSSGPVDNLYTRGPFYKGVSETHEQFVNRGGIVPRKYYEFKRHYEEPGMRNDKSITQTDFGPQYSSNKSPCLAQAPKETQYVPKPSNRNGRRTNDCKPSRESEVIYVEEEPNRDFRTEHTDNYVCYQKPKEKNPLLDVLPEKKEQFHCYSRSTHQNGPFGVPPKCPTPQSTKKAPKRKQCLTNSSYPNGYMILPSHTS